ncbi:hypothetical protein [Streptomyces sp. NPDC088725]|uniref:hypothetical protein n=1 Tax=Streptomyces sp. NPDC088725 TaxID=3365873 RepID=UPI00380866AA
MTSEARRILSGLSDTFGTDGRLRVPKSGPGIEGRDIVSWTTLDWPPCECGRPVCPDAKGNREDQGDQVEQDDAESEQESEQMSPTMRRIRAQMQLEKELKRKGGYR